MSNNINLYKEAVRNNWTFSSNQGVLTVTQLAQLPLTSSSSTRASLDDVAIRLFEEVTKQAKLSFVNRKSTDSTDSLKLELVKDLISTQEAENLAKVNAKAVQSHNAVIDELIARKQLEELSNKSVEELTAMKK